MAGLLNVGADYQNRALSGFIRESAEQQEIDTTNKELKAARKAQKTTMAVTGTVLGGAAGYAGYLSAAGVAGGPVGMVAGAGLGFLLSQLF